MYLKVPAGRLYSMHFDYVCKNTITNGDDTIRVSISNLFKGVKVENAI